MTILIIKNPANQSKDLELAVPKRNHTPTKLTITKMLKNIHVNLAERISGGAKRGLHFKAMKYQTTAHIAETRTTINAAGVK